MYVRNYQYSTKIQTSMMKRKTIITAIYCMLNYEIYVFGVLIIVRSDYRGCSDYEGMDYRGSTVYSNHLGSFYCIVDTVVLINFYPKWEALYPTRSSSSPAGLFTCKITFLDQEKGLNTPSVLAAEFDLAFGLWPWPTDHVTFGLRQPCSSLSTIKICAWLFFDSSIVCFLLTLKIA